MANERETGGPAFPTQRLAPWTELTNRKGPNEPEFYVAPDQSGLTLRDYFAAKALAGIMASGTSDAALVANEHGVTVVQVVAMTAYQLADAMLKERAK